MNLLDLAVLVAVAVGAFVGFRIGFVARALSWLGLAIGLAIGLRLTPRVVRSLADQGPGVRLLTVAALVVGLALIGHTTGLVGNEALRRRLHWDRTPTTVDRLTGGVLGSLGALVLLWLLAPALRSTPGWTAEATDGSALVALVDRFAPRPPHAARVLGRLVSEAPYPVLDGNVAAGRPPDRDAGPLVDTDTARAAVLVVSRACGVRVSGTGFAVAPDEVVTNAHVVAGASSVRVETLTGETRDARVVRFNGLHDIAVLHVPGADLPPLALGRVRLRKVASVLGHPNGGRLRATPARPVRIVDNPRSDITRTRTVQTRVLVLAAHLIVGDSGAPVVGRDGRVQAMVFAVDPANRATAFALTSAEIAPFVPPRAVAADAPGADVGECLAG